VGCEFAVGTFRRRLDPELQALQDSVRSRGHADIAGGRSRVSSLVSVALETAGLTSDPQARLWAHDRVRYFVVFATAGWLEILERLPEDFPQLQAEFAALVSSPERFEAGDLVAWWWHLDSALFQPLLEKQFAQDPLVEGLVAAAERDESFMAQLIDWASLRF
jgi:hypothetical protein